MAMSIGTLLLAGGTKGKVALLPNLWILIHQRSAGFQGQSTDIEIHARKILNVRELAAERGITPGQLALAWVLHRGEHVVPIPGTKRVSYLEENLAAAEVTLSDAEVEHIAEAVPAAAGDRYPEAVMRSIDV